MNEDRMLKWFAFDHLPDGLKDCSRPFHALASDLINQLEAGPERTEALRELLKAKDAAVRALVHPGG